MWFFAECQIIIIGGRHEYTHALELAKSQIITRLVFMPEFPRQSYGVYKNYAVLIELSEDFNQFALWFFKGLQETAPLLFQKRLAGEISETTKNNAINIRYGFASFAPL